MRYWGYWKEEMLGKITNNMYICTTICGVNIQTVEMQQMKVNFVAGSWPPCIVSSKPAPQKWKRKCNSNHKNKGNTNQGTLTTKEIS